MDPASVICVIQVLGLDMHSGAEGGRNQLSVQLPFYRPKLIPYSINLQKCKRNDYDLTRRPQGWP